MLQIQQASINDLKKITALLLKKPKQKNPKTVTSSARAKEGKNSTSENIGDENFEYGHRKSSSEELENSHNEDNHAKKINELEKCLEAIANRSDPREVEMVRPCTVE